MKRRIDRRQVLIGGGVIAGGLAFRPVLAAAAEDACNDEACGAVLAAYRISAPEGARDMQPASLSHDFKPGDVPAGFHAEPRLAVDLPLLAWEVEAETHADGSWKTAAYRFELPRLKPGESFVLEIVKRAGAPKTQPVDPLGLAGEGGSASVAAAALVGYAPPDGGAEAADALRPGEWSANLQRNNYRDGNPPIDGAAGYWFMPRSKTADVVSSYSRNLAYGNGAWLPDRLRFVLTGGGHNDWAGSEILVFDLRSLRWTRADDSCRYWRDETWDGSSLAQWDSPRLDRESKVAATFIPAHVGHELGQYPFYPWPNIRGRRAPVSTHTYGYIAYDAPRGRVWNIGTSLWPASGGYNGGLWAIDADTLTWDEASTLVLPAEANPGYTGKLVSLTGDRVLLHTGGDRTLRLIDLKTGRVADTTEPAGKYQGDNLFVADDPEDPGHKAAYYSLWEMGDGFVKQPRCDRMPDEPGYRLATEVRFRNERPAALDHRATPVAMGDHGRNPRQVVFLSPRTDEHAGGLAIYDTGSASWSEVPVRLPKVRSAAVFKGFDYIPAYDAFALCAGDAEDRGRTVVLLLKRPPQVD